MSIDIGHVTCTADRTSPTGCRENNPNNSSTRSGPVGGTASTRSGPVGGTANHDHGTSAPSSTTNNPRTSTNGGSAPPAPPPQIHIRSNDGGDFKLDSTMYEIYDTKTICDILNQQCMIIDGMSGQRHHPIDISVVEFYKPKTAKPIPTIQTIDTNKPPKDAIEPFYGIEVALFSSVATLKTLYETGVLIKNSIFAKKDGTLGNTFPNDESTIGHIFRVKDGHITDTPENRKLIESIANNKANYLGDDKYGNQWFGKTNVNGTQHWVRVKDNKITNAGINPRPKDYNPETGLNRPDKPNSSIVPKR